MACSSADVPSQEIEGYSFVRNPKGTSAQEAVAMILGQVNAEQAQQAAAAGENQYTGVGQVNEDGTVELPHPTDTDYLIVTDSAAFQHVLEAQDVVSAQPNQAAPADFKHEFVVLLIHPPVAAAGATFHDELEAEAAADNTVRLVLSSTSKPATALQGVSYGEPEYQVSMYKLPKKDFKRASIVFAEQEDAKPVYVPL
ncbi:hypothetical protein [Hymenobacter cellulosilyticus]|uniref:Uncharacterized protein n=1 Tax=Hymenobacter cellulosilyticus TaxID=2932248 RepID=A0A8T9QCY2_9BACT|nr:hypothetical protein [Hymenobacter cellulosilyticus]UOQ73978.1 hypothetical protein MUN79_08800 [Hymenobacter cellulosilyticus]